MSDVRPGNPAQEVVIEVRRRARSPRYHRGALVAGTVTVPEQCNTDQAGKGTRHLDALPVGVRPNQLCRRCWRSTILASAVLDAADALTAATPGGAP